MKEKKSTKELNHAEIALVSGGTNMPGILGGIAFTAQIGWSTGTAINSFNQTFSGRSLGSSIYDFFH